MNISGRGDLSEALQHIRTSGTRVALKGRTLLYVTVEAAYSVSVCKLQTRKSGGFIHPQPEGLRTRVLSKQKTDTITQEALLSPARSVGPFMGWLTLRHVYKIVFYLSLKLSTNLFQKHPEMFY